MHHDVVLLPRPDAQHQTPQVALIAGTVVGLGVMLVIWFVVTLGFSALDRAYLDVVAKERALAETIEADTDAASIIDDAAEDDSCWPEDGPE